MISSKASKTTKEIFSEKKVKHNLSLILSNETNTKKLEKVLVENKPEYFFKNILKKLPKHSEDVQFKYLKHSLNSINEFLLLLVMSFVGSQLKILRMSWYTSMKPFRTNLELVIKKYLCSWHDSFDGVDSSSNYQVLSVTSKYISS